MDDQVNIELIQIRDKLDTLKHEAHEDRLRIISLEEFNEKTLIRLDQEIENRTRAFELIEDLNDKFDEHKHDIEVQFERIEDILVVHRNQDRAQKNNYKALIDVWDKTVMKIIEKGEHGEHK